MLKILRLQHSRRYSILLFSNMLFIKPTNLELYHSLFYPIGMSHGVLFIDMFYWLSVESKNDIFKTLFIILIASLIPLFYVEKKYLKNV
jgi:hypothetical protein